jgi:hypothetical protein
MVFRLMATTVSLAWFVVPRHIAHADTPSVSSAEPAATSTGFGAQVRSALRQELDGKNAERNALLQQVVEQSADQPQAHWHLGEIKTDGKWMPYERVVDDAEDRWHKLYLYRKTRDERKDTADDHFFVADGAHERGMWDEERAHLKRIVELDWDNAEARARLGDVNIDGFWVPREDIVAFNRILEETRRNRTDWDAKVQQIVRRLFRSREKAWELNWRELQAICDPAAIPSVEAAFAEGNEQAALWYLDWLNCRDTWQASVALVRQAVLAPSATIRSAAQTHLKDRRVDDYAPILLSAMRADPEITAHLSQTAFGGLLYVQHIALETQYDVRVRNLAVIYGPETGFASYQFGILPISVPGTGRLADFPAEMAGAFQHVRRYYGAFSAGEGRGIEVGIDVGNDRLVRTFSAATGLMDLEQPEDCWDWWNGYQQVYVAAPKPLRQRDYEETWTVDRRRRHFVRTPQRDVGLVLMMSCFAAGTPIVTEYGPKPIEEVQLGDRVLSQDVETGELAFKPVFKTTVRPPVPLLKITTDRGELICTGGHPFWVNGESWLYARELQPGMRFHSVDGASEILSVEDAGREEKAYNLIVADFHTYFVGEGRVLCHDNTPRAPTNALVPGLMPDWQTIVAKH